MGFKRGYLFLTVTLIALSLGTGFAMHDKHSRMHEALQSLETAKLQLSRSGHAATRQGTALLLIDQAIREINHGLAADNGGRTPQKAPV